MVELGETRLIHVAPATGRSGVGDYADDFIAALRPHFGEVIEIRHGGPGDDTIRDVIRVRRRIKALLAETAPQHQIVHVELSSGAFLPFWITASLGRARVTATVHDPPYAVWYPFRTRLLALRWYLVHMVHLPIMKLVEVIERRVLCDMDLFVLTHSGAEAARGALRRSRVIEAEHIETRRPDLPAAEQRPRAVGMFGYAYRTKGLWMISQLRELLDDHIDFRVAGRGTEALPAIPGVEVLGEVNGRDEDDFFASIRLLVMPFEAGRVYGRVMYPASGVERRAVSYQTPVLRAGSSESSLGEEPGVIGTEPREIAEYINAVMRNEAHLRQLGEQARTRRNLQDRTRVVEPFLQIWRDG